mgnify:CR=1 FL=1
MLEIENNVSKNWVTICPKGDMLLEKDNATKEYQLTYSMFNLKKLNINYEFFIRCRMDSIFCEKLNYDKLLKNKMSFFR